MKSKVALVLVAALVTVSALSISNGTLSVPAPGLAPPADPGAGQDIAASGMVEADEIDITAEVAGRVIDVPVEEGDRVSAGQVLMVLDASVIDTQMAEAHAAVAAAAADLESARAPVRAEEIAVARADLLKAQASERGAEQAWRAALDMRDNPLDLTARINQARSQIDIAAKQVEATKAQLVLAEAARDRTQFAASDQEKTQHQVSLKQVEASRAAIAGAQAARDGAQRQLDILTGMRDNPLALKAAANSARSQLDLARQTVLVAQAELDLLEAGPRPEDVAVARARWEAALAALDEIEVQRSRLTLTAPVSGVLTTRSVEPGETASAGQALLKIADLDRVTLKVYVPETDIGQVTVGQPADVRVDAFPGRAFRGWVAFIASEAEFTPKKVQTPKERVNMVFAVKVRLPNPDLSLKPGMPADAVVLTGEPAAETAIAAVPGFTDLTPSQATALLSEEPTRPATPEPEAAASRSDVSAMTLPAATAAPVPPSPTPPRRAPRPTPAPSPTGLPVPVGRLVFASRGADGTYALWVSHADGSERRLVADGMRQPDVRGDGMVVANGEGRAGGENLLTVSLDGSERIPGQRQRQRPQPEVVPGRQPPAVRERAVQLPDGAGGRAARRSAPAGPLRHHQPAGAPPGLGR